MQKKTCLHQQSAQINNLPVNGKDIYQKNVNKVISPHHVHFLRKGKKAFPLHDVLKSENGSRKMVIQGQGQRQDSWQ